MSWDPQFPANAEDGDKYTYQGRTFTYDEPTDQWNEFEPASEVEEESELIFWSYSGTFNATGASTSVMLKESEANPLPANWMLQFPDGLNLYLPKGAYTITASIDVVGTPAPAITNTNINLQVDILTAAGSSQAVGDALDAMSPFPSAVTFQVAAAGLALGGHGAKLSFSVKSTPALGVTVPFAVNLQVTRTGDLSDAEVSIPQPYFDHNYVTAQAVPPSWTVDSGTTLFDQYGMGETSSFLTTTSPVISKAFSEITIVTKFRQKVYNADPTKGPQVFGGDREWFSVRSATNVTLSSQTDTQSYRNSFFSAAPAPPPTPQLKFEQMPAVQGYLEGYHASSFNLVTGDMWQSTYNLQGELIASLEGAFTPIPNYVVTRMSAVLQGLSSSIEARFGRAAVYDKALTEQQVIQLVADWINPPSPVVDPEPFIDQDLRGLTDPPANWEPLDAFTLIDFDAGGAYVLEEESYNNVDVIFDPGNYPTLDGGATIAQHFLISQTVQWEGDDISISCRAASNTHLVTIDAESSGSANQVYRTSMNADGIAKNWNSPNISGSPFEGVQIVRYDIVKGHMWTYIYDMNGVLQNRYTGTFNPWTTVQTFNKINITMNNSRTDVGPALGRLRRFAVWNSCVSEEHLADIVADWTS